MGNIITAVAVFDTHLLKNAVTAMNPPTIRRGCVPTTLRVRSAIRL